ncbi:MULTISPECIES: helix-turn-helix domain-containing protein [Proteus]|uniref:helix-turn-helix domain-containing protein n=1 Tax=Proteus TaxID=583 RepID=UPI0013780B3A|nr:helix-turn-helix transcriptional regulator [Proteus sp. G2665]HAU5529993.1 XRE family transcriptional regulator [Proteus mirabilis]NBN04351.1 helix-turn-helix domain-containing protein [Proteus sp. G2665]HAU5551930.1 XRE family transcriptional regulator [Proteus mirabilis]HAU5567835.1 XRE family transcriptional regulator [Proteus mirabilis]HAU5575218.1 XRE family transcriptional regulator [Proteus mirabilis]
MRYNISSASVRIGAFFQKHRRLLGMSGKILGQKLNISQQHISRLERGQATFSIEIILQLLNEIDKTLLDLIVEVFYEDPCEVLIEYQRLR